MTEQIIKEVFPRMSNFLVLGARVFIVTKQNHIMPRELTYSTTLFNGKIFDEHWQINIEDVERFEIA